MSTLILRLQVSENHYKKNKNAEYSGVNTFLILEWNLIIISENVVDAK